MSDVGTGITLRGRVLVCTRCRSSVEVLEAAHGARTDAEHRFIDPSRFVCGGCLERDGDVVTGALSVATVAVGSVERYSGAARLPSKAGAVVQPVQGREGLALDVVEDRR
jgi:hypothetical protein